MTPVPTPVAAPLWHTAHAARTANAADLTHLLTDSRVRTLALADAYAKVLGDDLLVPYAPQLNPPLWELGHIGWFQAYWIARNPHRARGWDADPLCPRSESLMAGADTLYDSTQVPHDTRWTLPLPDLHTAQAYLAQGLQQTLHLLETTASTDRDLYFFRLALFHEDMHSEAAIYMAQALGIALPDAVTQSAQAPHASCSELLRLPAGNWQLGYGPAPAVTEQLPASVGFAFDNEIPAHCVSVPACEIDSLVVTWQQFLPFVEAGGYTQPQWWSEQGWAWLQSKAPILEPGHTQPRTAPRYLRRVPGVVGKTLWECNSFGVWRPLDLAASACYLSYFEAQAWCRWAGRSLPTEVQWECSAMTLPGFEWGDVWEWTASTFEAYPGFVAHPYQDYSAPWFGSRPVLRGASWASNGRMVHPRYRNYFTPERNDIVAGFRSCMPLTSV